MVFLRLVALNNFHNSFPAWWLWENDRVLPDWTHKSKQRNKFIIRLWDNAISQSVNALAANSSDCDFCLYIIPNNAQHMRQTIVCKQKVGLLIQCAHRASGKESISLYIEFRIQVTATSHTTQFTQRVRKPILGVFLEEVAMGFGSLWST